MLGFFPIAAAPIAATGGAQFASTIIGETGTITWANTWNLKASNTVAEAGNIVTNSTGNWLNPISVGEVGGISDSAQQIVVATSVLAETGGLAYSTRLVTNPGLSIGETGTISTAGGAPSGSESVTIAETGGISTTNQFFANQTVTIATSLVQSETTKLSSSPNFQLDGVTGIGIVGKAVMPMSITLAETTVYTATGGNFLNSSILLAEVGGIAISGVKFVNNSITLGGTVGFNPAPNLIANVNLPLPLNFLVGMTNQYIINERISLLPGFSMSASGVIGVPTTTPTIQLFGTYAPIIFLEGSNSRN